MYLAQTLKYLFFPHQLKGWTQMLPLICVLFFSNGIRILKINILVHLGCHN